jgi:hypothetical protein
MTQHIISRVFTKRETEKSNWSGRIGAVEGFADLDRIVINGHELPEASVAYLLNFSLQSLQDAYAGADDLTEATANWEKKLSALIDGTIGVRSGGSGMTDEERAELYVAESIYATKYGKDTDKGKAFRELKDDDKAEFLVGIAAKLREQLADFEDRVAKRVEHVVEMRKRRAEEKAAAKAADILDL